MATTPLNIPQSVRANFQAGMEHIAQQMQSRFKSWATVKTGCTGKSQAHRKIGKAEMDDDTGRIQPTNGQEMELFQRFAFPRRAKLATVIDEDDAAELELGVAPTGEILTQHQAAASRKVDRIFLAGITGTNYEGLEDSMTAVTMLSAYSGKQIINLEAHPTTVSNSGMTLYKLTKAKSRFGTLEVYGQEQKAAGAKLCMAVSQDELDNLLLDATTYVGNLDYNKLQALVEGEIDYFMGIHFMRTELLPTVPAGTVITSALCGASGTDSSTVASGKIGRGCPMWVSNGVHLDFWYDVKTNIDVLPTQSQAIQVYSRIKVAAARKGEDRVVIVYCEQDA